MRPKCTYDGECLDQSGLGNRTCGTQATCPHKAEDAPEVDVGDGWRQLREGEIIRTGDEFEYASGIWMLSNSTDGRSRVGDPYHDFPYRRRIAPQPPTPPDGYELVPDTVTDWSEGMMACRKGTDTWYTIAEQHLDHTRWWYARPLVPVWAQRVIQICNDLFPCEHNRWDEKSRVVLIGNDHYWHEEPIKPSITQQLHGQAVSAEYHRRWKGE